MALDLTPFGFTPTESLVYGILVTRGPGTGYAVARAAGLARANAYAALEGLVGKGAARAEPGPPRRFRPEPGSIVLARILDRQGGQADQLATELTRITLPASPGISEVTSLRGVTQTLGLEAARARRSVALLLPADLYPGLIPALRHVATLPIERRLFADGPVAQAVVDITTVPPGDRWPGRPLLAVIDDRLALIGSLGADGLGGLWGTSAPFLAAARLAIEALTSGDG